MGRGCEYERDELRARIELPDEDHGSDRSFINERRQSINHLNHHDAQAPDVTC